MNDRRDGIEEGKRVFAGHPRYRLGQRRRGEGTGRDDDVVPVGGRKSGDFLAADIDQRLGSPARR